MNYRVLVVGLTDKSDGLKKPIYNVKITESAFVTLLHISMDGYNLKVLEYVLAVKQTTDNCFPFIENSCIGVKI